MRTLSDQWDDMSGKWTDAPDCPLRPVEIKNLHTGVLVQHRQPELAAIAKLAEREREVRGWNR